VGAPGTCTLAAVEAGRSHGGSSGWERRRALACLLALATALAGAAPAAAPPAPTVVWISLDGVGADLPDAAHAPGLARMEREGARAARLEPPFPPLTFPSHVTLATGAPVARHGIVANAFRDRERGLFRYGNDPSWIRAEPIWAAAERQGVPSAVFFWVGSEGPWQGVAPGRFEAPFASAVPESEKVDRILEWLDLPADERPRLLMSWWHGADAAGHRHGPDAPEVRAALEAQDAELRRLLEGIDRRGLWSRLTLIVVSDHGMAAVALPIDLEEPAQGFLVAGGLGLLGRGPAHVGLEAVGAEVLVGGGVASVHLEDPARRDDARAVLAALPEVRVFAPDELPARWRYGPPDRLGELVAVTEPPSVFRAGTLDSVVQRLGLTAGAHGYDPARSDMGAILFAKGRGVKAGTRLGEVAAEDVAPTVSALLGIAPPRDATGHAIAELTP